MFEFGALGTYVAEFTIGANNQAYSDTATYTFHVGPASDLEARAADSVLGVGSGQTALTVLAVNNGPDDALGAKVNIGLDLPDGVRVREVVASGGNYDDDNGIWDLGGLRHSEQRRAARLPDGETLTFLLAGNGAESATLDATIYHDNENHPYTVCIDADGNDVDAASQAACEPGGEWHTGTVYDWKPGNDTVTLGARRDLAAEALPTLVEVEGGPLALHEGGDAGEYTVVLGSRPSHDVRIRVSSDNPDVTVDTDDATEGNQHTLTFTPLDWPNAQTVYVSAGHDADAVNDTATLTHTASSSDGGFNRVRIATVSVDVDDDEPPEIQVGPLSHSPLNEGESATYTVSLTAPPTRNVPLELVVTVFVGDDPDVTVRPASFTLNRNNWNTGRTITVTAGEDDDGLDDTVTITHIPSADAAAEYRGKTAKLVVNVLDDDVPGVRVSESSLSLVEGHASNASRTYTVRLNMAPTADVEIDFTSDDTSAVTVAPSSLTFTAENSATDQTVTVTAVDDDDAQDETATISGTITTTDPDYTNVPVSSITISVEDDDTAGITLSPLTPSQVTEGGTATYDVVLDAEPTGNVVINLTSDNDGVTVAPTPLTFTSQNWNAPQAVTVTAAEDDDGKDETAKVTHTVDDASSADEYDGLSTTQAVSVTDNDVPGLTLTTPADGLQVRESGEASYTVELQTEPSANVVVDISSNNGDVTVAPSRLTFTVDNWNTAQDVTVMAGVDSDGNDDQFTLTHRASSSAASEYRQVRDTLAGTVTETAINYDSDGNGLIEIRTAAQLGAVRYDLNGDQKADDSADDAAYKRAFPQAGCENENGDRTACSTDGYELANDITLSGGWTPIGGDLSGGQYDAKFYGNGNVIRNLQISRSNGKNIGLFGAVGSKGFIYHVGLENVNVRGRGNVGALVGRNEGRIEYAWSTGRVSGNSFTGGLVGWNFGGAIRQSYSEADVTGFNASDSGGPLWATRIAGLVGGNHGNGTVENSYATGKARGRGHVAGLAGENNGGGTIRNSYATGAVSTEADFPHKGGLVGWQLGTVIASYWDTKTTGQDEGVAQGGKSGAVGYTTDELQKPTAPGAKEGDIYYGWDADTWNFDPTDAPDYPCLAGLGGCPGGSAVAAVEDVSEPASQRSVDRRRPGGGQ